MLRKTWKELRNNHKLRDHSVEETLSSNHLPAAPMLIAHLIAVEARSTLLVGQGRSCSEIAPFLRRQGGDLCFSSSSSKSPLISSVQCSSEPHAIIRFVPLSFSRRLESKYTFHPFIGHIPHPVLPRTCTEPESTANRLKDAREPLPCHSQPHFIGAPNTLAAQPLYAHERFCFLIPPACARWAFGLWLGTVATLSPGESIHLHHDVRARSRTLRSAMTMTKTPPLGLSRLLMNCASPDSSTSPHLLNNGARP